MDRARRRPLTRQNGPRLDRCDVIRVRRQVHLEARTQVHDSFILLVPYEHRTGLVRELWVVASPLAFHSGRIGAALDPKEAS